MNARSIGILSVLLASLLWALEPVLAKLSYQNSDFEHTLAVRAILVTLTALVYVVMTNRGNLRIDKRQLSALVYVAFAANVFGDIAYFFALTRIPVVNAVLIGNMQPIFIVMMGFLVLREERLTKFDYLGIVVMMTAGILIATRSLENLLTFRLGTYGDLVVLSATVAWSTTTIAFRKYLREMNAGVVTFYRFLFASLVFAAYLMSSSGFAAVNMYQLMIGIVVGIGTILYFEGLKRNKAAEVSALELSTPLFAAVLGFLVLGELVTQIQIVGMSLLLIGVFFLSRREEPVPYRCC
ncbi:MAG: DMT family transporter [Candidatus Bathyarchaeia archaeon]